MEYFTEDNFITEKEAKALLSYYFKTVGSFEHMNDHNLDHMDKASGEPGPEGERNVSFNPVDRNLRCLAEKTIAKVLQKTCKKYNEEYLFPSYASIMYTETGRGMDDHDDKYGNGDEYEPDYTVIIYLNDDFTGGETYVGTKENRDYIKPRTGKLLAFDSAKIHGVNTVTEGSRYVLIMWLKKELNDLWLTGADLTHSSDDTCCPWW